MRNSKKQEYKNCWRKEQKEANEYDIPIKAPELQ